jgi:hypothetical protein
MAEVMVRCSICTEQMVKKGDVFFCPRCRKRKVKQARKRQQEKSYYDEEQDIFEIKIDD